MGILFLVSFLFYDSAAAALFLWPLLLPFLERERVRREKRRSERCAEQFRDTLVAVTSAMKAGESAENAFRSAAGEMLQQYGRESPICQELSRIERGLDNRIPLESLLDAFAQRLDVEEITEFARVFAIARRGGGEMVAIMERTVSLIDQRVRIQSEIRVLIEGRRMESRIMDLVPFGIITYISLASPGFFSVLYHNAVGVLFMTLCLAAWMAALLLSDRILAIRV